MIHSGNELINPWKTLERAGLERGMLVADLGCGSLGHFVFPAAQMVGGDGRVYAVDIDKAALKRIEHTAKQEQFWNVIPIWGDIEVQNAIRIHDASLDLTIVANNLYLSSNRDGLVAEAVRLTKPGGHILLIEWLACETVIGPPEHKRLAPDQAKDILLCPDLTLVDEFQPGDCHYALVYKRSDVREPIVESMNPAEF